MLDAIVRGRRVVTDAGIGPASIHIAAGKIATVAGADELPAHGTLIDAGDRIVMAGLVDSHVHVNEPGRTEWEGYETATRAAAAGGITTIVDMPLNSIPATTTLAALDVKRRTAEGKCWVDVAFWGGVVPGNTGELLPMVDAGVCGFKCFLVPSGVDEFAHVGEAELVPAMHRLADAGVPLLVHAELAGPIAEAERAVASSSRLRYLTYLASRPRTAEDEAVALMVRLGRQTRSRVHIVHHSSSTSLALLAAARDDGLAISAETCPHYLHFDAEAIPDGATQFKCAPPIRERENRDKLWELGLEAGTLDMVVSDHSPCRPELKRGDYLDAWGGIASLQLTLPVVWTEARQRGVSIATIADWMCRAPARLAGLADRKGSIAPGHDADLVIWDPDAAVDVDGARLHHRHSTTPYDGERLFGRVDTTLLGGQVVFDRSGVAARPTGRLIRRA